MSKRKAKKPWLRLISNNGRTVIPKSGFANVVRDPDAPPLVQSMRYQSGDTIIADEAFEKMGVKFDLPADEKEIIKEVPAKVDGTVVGIAQIYSDGTVGVIVNDDAPQWAKDKIQLEADKLGYTIGGEPDGST
jgi:hypothetical protein